MELVDVLRISLAIIGVLVTTFCVVVWSELKKLRQQGHRHSNRLAELGLAMSLVLGKLRINSKTYEDEEE